MKKLILAITLLTFGSNLNAQQSDESMSLNGRWFLMGQAGYNSSNEGDTQSYNFIPQVGTFVAEDVALGLGIGYQGTKEEREFNDMTNTDKSELFIIKPLARKYWNINEKLYFFGELAVPFGFGKITNENTVGNTTSSTEAKYTNIGVQLAPGLDYYLSNNWSIEATIGLLGWNSVKPEEGDASNSFNFGLNSGVDTGVKIGVKYLF